MADLEEAIKVDKNVLDHRNFYGEATPLEGQYKDNAYQNEHLIWYFFVKSWSIFNF